MADLQSLLEAAPIPKAVKADAWDAYQSAVNEDDLADRLNKLAVPKSVKADLWDLKHSEAAVPAQTGPQISPEELASRQAASKQAFESNLPTYGSRLMEGLKEFGKTALDINREGGPRLSTGQESTGHPALDAALGVMGGASTTRVIPLTSAKLPQAFNTAGHNFQDVMAAAKDVPVDTSKMAPILNRIEELRQAGAENIPAVAGKLKEAIESGPLNYGTARDFASSAGKKLAGLARLVNPPDARVEAQVAQLAGALGSANREAAASVGMGEAYDQAMKEYRANKGAISFAKLAAKYAAGATLGYKAYNALGELSKYF